MTISMKISNQKKSRIVSVNFDADRFERVAANFGLFNELFLHSVDRAERDIKAGRVREIGSLQELRK